MLFYMGGEPTDFMHSRWAFKEGLQEFGAESFSTLQRCVKEECPNPSLKVSAVMVPTLSINPSIQMQTGGGGHMALFFHFSWIKSCWLCAHGICVVLQHVLALLRLGNHDADVFFKFKQVLIDKVSFPYSTELVQHDVKDEVEKGIERLFSFPIDGG